MAGGVGLFHMEHCTSNSGSWTVDSGQWAGNQGAVDHGQWITAEGRSYSNIGRDATGRGPVFGTRGQIYMGLCEKI